MLHRRTVLSALLAAPVCARAIPAFAEAAELSVGGIYGGVWAESIRQAFLLPFASKTGTKLQIEEGISGVTLAKLRQQKSDPQFDVVWMDRVVSDQAIREGLIEPIPTGAISDLGNVVPEALIKDKAGQVMAVTTGYWAAGLSYNKKETEHAPQSWLDLKNPAYKGHVAVYSPENAICFPILVTLAEALGGSATNLDPAFKFMAEVAKAGGIFFGGSPAGGNLLGDGEVEIASLASSQVWDMQAHKLPVDYVVPKEGAVAGDIRIHIVKGAKHPDTARKLVDYVVGPEAQLQIATRLLLGPVNNNVKLPTDIDAKMPWGPHGSVARLKIVDANLILDKRDEWTKRWNEEVAH